MLLTFGLRGAGSGRGSELVWFGLESGEVEEGWCCTFDVCAVVTYLNRRTHQRPEARKLLPLAGKVSKGSATSVQKMKSYSAGFHRCFIHSHCPMPSVMGWSGVDSSVLGHAQPVYWCGWCAV